jgi:hypothetical protein
MVGIGRMGGEGKMSLRESFDFGWFGHLVGPIRGVLWVKGFFSCSKIGSFMYSYFCKMRGYANFGGPRLAPSIHGVGVAVQ